MSKDCCERNFQAMENHLRHIGTKARIKFIKLFKGKLNPSIDIGCGGFMPKYLDTSHACDDSGLAIKYLKSIGWKGKFKEVDIKKKFPYKDKEFKIGICSEVIEHLRTKKQVFNVFKEIDRISESWIITTPSIYIPDKDHHLFFFSGNIFDFLPFKQEEIIVINNGDHFYISKDIKKMEKIFNVKWKK